MANSAQSPGTRRDETIILASPEAIQLGSVCFGPRLFSPRAECISHPVCLQLEK